MQVGSNFTRKPNAPKYANVPAKGRSAIPLSLDPDLPEEARALLLTPESLLDLAISKGKTLNDSRWAPRNFDKRWDHSKPLPPKQYPPKVEPITPPSSSRKQFRLSPTAEKFTSNSTPPKQHELSPKAEPFIPKPMTTSIPSNKLELSLMVPFSIPSSYKMCGLDGSRYADKRQNTIPTLSAAMGPTRSVHQQRQTQFGAQISTQAPTTAAKLGVNGSSPAQVGKPSDHLADPNDWCRKMSIGSKQQPVQQKSTAHATEQSSLPKVRSNGNGFVATHPPASKQTNGVQSAFSTTSQGAAVAAHFAQEPTTWASNDSSSHKEQILQKAIPEPTVQAVHTAPPEDPFQNWFKAKVANMKVNGASSQNSSQTDSVLSPFTPIKHIDPPTSIVPQPSTQPTPQNIMQPATQAVHAPPSEDSFASWFKAKQKLVVKQENKSFNTNGNGVSSQTSSQIGSTSTPVTPLKHINPATGMTYQPPMQPTIQNTIQHTAQEFHAPPSEDPFNSWFKAKEERVSYDGKDIEKPTVNKPADNTTSQKEPVLPTHTSPVSQDGKFLQHMDNPTGPFNRNAYGKPKLTSTRLTNAFDNEKFKLNESSTATFQDFLARKNADPATNGKKYTFNGPAPKPETDLKSPQAEVFILAPAAYQLHRDSLKPAVQALQQAKIENNAALTVGQSELAATKPSHRPKLNGTTDMKHPLQPPQNRVQPVENKKATIPQFGKTDPHAVFSPSQLPPETKGTLVCKQQPQIQPQVQHRAKPRRWPSQPLDDAQFVNAMIISELQATDRGMTNTVDLTQSALVTATGFKPREECDSLDGRVSDAGIDPAFVDPPKENVRATQAADPTVQLLDWDGKNWAPAPCDWEYDRGKFDDSFIPDYIKEWSPALPCGPSVEVDMTESGFTFGTHPVDNDTLIDPIPHPECLPDTGNSSDEAKRLHQTAQIEVLHFTVKREKQQKRSKRYADANTAAKKAFVFKQENSKPEPNPFSPKIEMYIRPAMEKDDQGIAKIYNEHAVGSIIPEDQERLDPSFAKHIVETLRDERLPFIVAVKGRMPSLNDAQGRSGPSKEANLPLSEAIIGFAFAERFNYGFAGGVKGRSRATLNLQLYVHPDHKKNYVGQNLLDRLMHLLTPARAFRNACDWLNPENNKIYEPGDSGRWHQVIFQIPTRKDPKDDPNIKWLSNFLYNKFHFKEEGCLPSVARSRPYGGQGKWLDLVIFQTEACHGDEWTGYQ